jgi:hypothetical protein
VAWNALPRTNSCCWGIVFDTVPAIKRFVWLVCVVPMAGRLSSVVVEPDISGCAQLMVVVETLNPKKLHGCVCSRILLFQEFMMIILPRERLSNCSARSVVRTNGESPPILVRLSTPELQYASPIR